MARWPPRVMQFDDYLMRKNGYKTMRFLVYMYYTHPYYQTSIFGKNCAYYIRIFTVNSAFKIKFQCVLNAMQKMCTMKAQI